MARRRKHGRRTADLPAVSEETAAHENSAPDESSPAVIAQRRREIARILAEGYLRLCLIRQAQARGQQTSADEESDGGCTNALLSPAGDDSCECR